MADVPPDWPAARAGRDAPALSASQTMPNRGDVRPPVSHYCRSATRHPAIFVSIPADHTALRERCNDYRQPRYSCPRTHGGCRSNWYRVITFIQPAAIFKISCISDAELILSSKYLIIALFLDLSYDQYMSKYCVTMSTYCLAFCASCSIL